MLLRLRHLINDPYVFRPDSIVKPKGESHPVAQSHISGLTPQVVHMCPSIAAVPPLRSLRPPPARSARSKSEMSRARVSTFHALPAPQSPAGSSSSQPNKTSTTKSGSECEATEADIIGDTSVNGRLSAMSRSASVGHARLKEVWSVDDSFLPRARPPSPLKLIKHGRHRSYSATSAPSELPARSSTLGRTSSRASLKIHPLSPPQSSDSSLPPVLDISPKDIQHNADVKHPPEQLGIRISNGLDSSEDITFAPCGHTSGEAWTPPARRARPYEPTPAASENGGHKSVEEHTLSSVPTAKSNSKRDRSQVPARLNRIRSLKKMRYLFDNGESKTKASAIRKEPLSPDVVLSVQCYEHNEWHEKAMADVIPKLRVLKLK